MRGSVVTLNALLFPLWSPLVGARAVESVPLHARAAPEIADAFISFDVPRSQALSDEDETETHRFHLEIGQVDQVCSPSNITINGESLSVDDAGIGHGLLHDASPSTSVIEATWSVTCFQNSEDEDGALAAEGSSILSVDVLAVDGAPVTSSTFMVQFHQSDPVRILTVVGPVTVSGGDFSAPSVDTSASDREKALSEDLDELDGLRHKLMDLEEAIMEKEQFIAKEYGFQPPSEEKCDQGRLRCAVVNVSFRMKTLLVDVLGEEAARNCGLFSWDDYEYPKDDSNVIKRPQSGSEHPMIGSSSSGSGSGSSGSSSSTSQDKAESSSWTAEVDDDTVWLYAIPVLPFLVFVGLIHCCCLRRRRQDPLRRIVGRESRREEHRRRIAERRARREERRAAAKAAVRKFFRRIFCRASLEDEEKEAERQHMLEAGPSSRQWIQADDVERRWQPQPTDFVIGSDVGDDDDDDQEEQRMEDRIRSRRVQYAESITLVGTDTSESGSVRDSEEGESLPESDDAASESGSVSGASESGASETSTTMEMDLARFREATLMVGNLVAAEEGRMREREEARRQWRRPASPAHSLPGYQSDDPYPPTYEYGSDVETEALAGSVSNGFRYVPGAPSEPAGARRDPDAKD